jgi:hypothetical protein
VFDGDVDAVADTDEDVNVNNDSSGMAYSRSCKIIFLPPPFISREILSGSRSCLSVSQLSFSHCPSINHLFLPLSLSCLMSLSFTFFLSPCPHTLCFTLALFLALLLVLFNYCFLWHPTLHFEH